LTTTPPLPQALLSLWANGGRARSRRGGEGVPIWVRIVFDIVVGSVVIVVRDGRHCGTGRGGMRVRLHKYSSTKGDPP
jgi:hypothetical protein